MVSMVENAEHIAPAFTLRVTEDFLPFLADLETALSQHGTVQRAPYLRIMMAAGPPSRLPQYLMFLANWKVWALSAIGSCAVGFFNKIGTHAADVVWDEVSTILRQPDMKPLADISTALSGAIKECGPHALLQIGLDGPDEFFGTTLQIYNPTPDAIACSLAIFSLHAERIATAISEAHTSDDGLLGPAEVEVQNDGTIILRWYTKQLRMQERKLPPLHQ